MLIERDADAERFLKGRERDLRRREAGEAEEFDSAEAEARLLRSGERPDRHRKGQLRSLRFPQSKI